MVYKQVLFEDNMETQAGDFNNMQSFINVSMNNLVADAIDGGNAYVGMAVSQVAATQVSINVGRLYWGGLQYSLDTPQIIDFQTVAGAMPVTQQRQVAIVAYGQTINSDVEPRNFVVDADTGQAQSESVSMLSEQIALVGPIPGVESPSPNYPAIPATNLLIAYVLLSPSGVVSIQQSTLTQLDNLTTIGNQVAALQQTVGQEMTMIATLQTALAGLAAQFANYCTLDNFNKLANLVNWCYNAILKLQIPTFVLNTIDNFFDASQSAVGTNVDGAYNAYIASGLRFGSGATSTGKLALNNPTEPLINTYGNYILPKPSGSRVRMDCSFTNLDWTVEALLNHPFWTFAPRQLGWGRYRYRCGPPYLPSGLNQVAACLPNVDPLWSFLMFDTEAWVQVPWSTVLLHPDFDCDYPRWVGDRWKYYWNDWVDVDYWSKVYTNFSYSHNLMAQSFLNAQDGWLSGITIYSMQPGFYQPLTLHITACDDQGVPDHTQTLTKIDLDVPGITNCYQNPILVGDIVNPLGYSGIVVGAQTAFAYQAAGYLVIQEPYPNQGVYDLYWPIPTYVYPVRIAFNPVFLKAGSRYAFHIHSTYAHQFACSVDRSCYQIHCGDFWDYDGNSWFRIAASPKSLHFMLHYLTWGNWGGQQNPGGQLHYDIQLQALQLAGGIANIDVLAEHIIPSATNLNYAVQVSGTWVPFAADPDSPSFTGNPPLLPFKVIFTGTSDLMPGVSIVNSQVKLTGPSMNSYHHISTSIPVNSTLTGIKVLATAPSFVPANHTLVGSIHYGATHMSPSVTASVVNPDGSTNFTWTFNQTGITAYQVELDGTTNGTGDNFVVSQRSSFSA